MTRIPWSRLAEYKAKNGLDSIEVIQHECAETEIVFAPVDEPVPPLPEPSPQPPEPPKPSPKPALVRILESMLEQAQAKIGEPVRRDLNGGLRIDLMVCKDGMTRIQLSREGVYPSVTEWATTLGYFPYPVPDCDQEQFSYHGRFYMRSAWPTPEMEVING